MDTAKNRAAALEVINAVSDHGLLRFDYPGSRPTKSKDMLMSEEAKVKIHAEAMAAWEEKRFKAQVMEMKYGKDAVQYARMLLAFREDRLGQRTFTKADTHIINSFRRSCLRYHRNTRWWCAPGVLQQPDGRLAALSAQLGVPADPDVYAERLRYKRKFRFDPSVKYEPVEDAIKIFSGVGNWKAMRLWAFARESSPELRDATSPTAFTWGYTKLPDSMALFGHEKLKCGGKHNPRCQAQTFSVHNGPWHFDDIVVSYMKGPKRKCLEYIQFSGCSTRVYDRTVAIPNTLCLSGCGQYVVAHIGAKVWILDMGEDLKMKGGCHWRENKRTPESVKFVDPKDGMHHYWNIEQQDRMVEHGMRVMQIVNVRTAVWAPEQAFEGIGRFSRNRGRLVYSINMGAQDKWMKNDSTPSLVLLDDINPGLPSVGYRHNLKGKLYHTPEANAGLRLKDFKEHPDVIL